MAIDDLPLSVDHKCCWDRADPPLDCKARGSIVQDAVEGIAQALSTFNETLASEGQSPVAIGIGAHLGEVVLGEIGAAGAAPRTLIGDTVNTASRIEGVTKEHQVQALISAPLLEKAGMTLPESEFVSLQLRGLNVPLPAWPVKEASTLHKEMAAKNRTGVLAT